MLLSLLAFSLGPDWAALCKVKGDVLPCWQAAPLGLARRREGDPSRPAPMVARQRRRLWMSPNKAIMKLQVLCAQEGGPGWQGYDY